MKRLMLYRIVSLIAIFFVSTSMINSGEHYLSVDSKPLYELLYDDVWGTIYHAEARQCDNTPTITGDGSIINPYHASKQRWIAVSQDLINDTNRAELIKHLSDNRFKGKIQYGDTVWIDSPYPEINGWWVVHDAKNKRYTNSIDFLQTKGDKELIKNYPYWSGKFDSVRVYRIICSNYKEIPKSLVI
jgi:hypothetical protein